ALAVAAIKQYVAKHKSKGKTFAAILCGANMNFDRLRFVAERAEVGEEREALFAVTIPEERGSFKRFCTLLATLPVGGEFTTKNIALQATNTPAKAMNDIALPLSQRNITEFTYRISDADKAHVFVGLTTTVKGESVKVAQTLTKNGFKALDLTHDDLARDHIRHMVGGHSLLAKDERLLRFEFPERPGALMKFLSAMRPDWNISLFHYRNQGADYGRILVGLQVNTKDNKAFDTFLKTLGYPYVEETNNPVYRLFLKS
ncbi:MAG: L-threonine dehydratase biosynthetic IlvA, partial [Pseudomonadota bacterium]